MGEYGTPSSIIKCTLSKVKFPEVCPVCLDEPFDLVPITVFERKSVARPPVTRADIFSSGPKPNFGRQEPETQSSVLFWIPACAAHMNIVTIKTKAIGALGFFILFYPALFFALAMIRDVRYGGNLLFDLVIFLIIVTVTGGLLAFGFMPRSLQRAIVFDGVNRGENVVLLRIHNDEYRRLFLEQNQSHADIMA